ncbi:MAG: hypothetical protein MAG431_02226 [Chloroflexi bacterium]|nr:hypothetical protein [Chloroflexota bacterium]
MLQGAETSEFFTVYSPWASVLQTSEVLPPVFEKIPYKEDKNGGKGYVSGPSSPKRTINFA